MGLLCNRTASIKASIDLGAEPKFVALISEHTEPSQTLVTDFLVFTETGLSCCIRVLNKND